MRNNPCLAAVLTELGAADPLGDQRHHAVGRRVGDAEPPTRSASKDGG
jgi:hypothetical protein